MKGGLTAGLGRAKGAVRGKFNSPVVPGCKDPVEILS